jgi:O-antigen biosynthesis protein
MSKSDLLILTGMHRSGTSLVASILQAAGVNVGESLLEPDKRNPHGFFEDKDFYEFHQQALYRCGELTPYVSADFVFQPTQVEIDQAVSMIQQRNNQPLWGWKDPRSCLFLDFWGQLLPEAQYGSTPLFYQARRTSHTGLIGSSGKLVCLQF